MKKSVKVAIHPESKAVVTKNTKKPEFGTIRVDQEVITMEGGFLNKTKRSAFIAGKLADLLAINYSDGQVLPGQIIRKESFEPMYEGHAAKINPTTKKEVLIDGKKVYFKDTYTENLSLQDSLISASSSEAVAQVAAEADLLNK